MHPLNFLISNFILCAFYETKRLFSLVIETVEREEESPVISDLVFSVKLQHFRRVAAALGLKKK